MDVITTAINTDINTALNKNTNNSNKKAPYSRKAMEQLLVTATTRKLRVIDIAAFPRNDSVDDQVTTAALNYNYNTLLTLQQTRVRIQAAKVCRKRKGKTTNKATNDYDDDDNSDDEEAITL